MVLVRNCAVQNRGGSPGVGQEPGLVGTAIPSHPRGGTQVWFFLSPCSPYLRPTVPLGGAGNWFDVLPRMSCGHDSDPLAPLQLVVRAFGAPGTSASPERPHPSPKALSASQECLQTRQAARTHRQEIGPQASR
jgi:hypothetical protein